VLPYNLPSYEVDATVSDEDNLPFLPFVKDGSK